MVPGLFVPATSPAQRAGQEQAAIASISIRDAGQGYAQAGWARDQPSSRQRQNGWPAGSKSTRTLS